jgi:hypothetical protein
MNSKDYTSLEISKQLAKAGFSAETDAWWIDVPGVYAHQLIGVNIYKDVEGRVPAYTAQTLLDDLKDDICEIRPCNAGVEVHRFISHNEREYVSNRHLADALGLMRLELISKKII